MTSDQARVQSDAEEAAFYAALWVPKFHQPRTFPFRLEPKGATK